jgi:hypothetical protein
MDSRLHRRRILALASSGIVAWGLSPLLGACAKRREEHFSAEAPTSPATDLEAALSRARAAHRPLLVMLSSEGGGLRWSMYFDVASDEAMAELSTFELVFASPAQVRTTLARANLEYEERPPLAVFVHAEAPSTVLVRSPAPEPEVYELDEGTPSASVRTWIGRVEAAVHSASGAGGAGTRDEATTHELAESLRRRLRAGRACGREVGPSHRCLWRGRLRRRQHARSLLHLRRGQPA